MKRLGIIGFLVIILFTPIQASAFGPSAHKVIARIAYNNITVETKSMIDAILALEEDSGDRTIERAAIWADTVRGDRRYDYLKALHYTNIPKRSFSYDKRRDCPTGDCLTEALPEYLRQLGYETTFPSERLIALKLVIHLAADIHQPLHLGLFEDRGGNSTRVRFRGDDTNLHAVWDSSLVRIRMHKKSVRHYARELGTRAKIAPWAGSISCGGDGVFKEWTEESRRIALESAYMIDGLNVSGFPGLAGGRDLSEFYIQKGVRITEERLMKAGIRLACLLDRALAAPGAW